MGWISFFLTLALFLVAGVMLARAHTRYQRSA